MLASVMPNCVAPMYASMFLMIRCATFARRFPFATSASSCVSRIRTSASSAATKKPFITTSAKTARIFKPLSVNDSQVILELHLAKNELQDIFQAHNSDFAPVESQYQRQPHPAAL